MVKIKGIGKRKRVKIRVSEEDLATVIRMLPIIFLIIFTLWILGWIGNIGVFHANVTGWP